MPTSFDLFGTLVSAQRPDDPASAVADALADRAVAVPNDWTTAYREPHAHLAPGEERSLAAHVGDALASRGVDAPDDVVRDATIEAFDRPVERRDGAIDAIDAARASGDVAVLSNCSVPGLIDRALERANLADAVDAVVTSVACGWRKPDPRAFEAVADALDTAPNTLVHVGDDPIADRGIEALGGRAVFVTETALDELATELQPTPEPTEDRP